MPLIALMIPYCVALKDSDLQLRHQFRHQQSKCHKKCCDSYRDIYLSFLPCKKMADLLCFSYHQFVQKQIKYNFACLIIFEKNTKKNLIDKLQVMDYNQRTEKMFFLLVPFKELQTTEYFQICTRSSIG